MDTKPNSLTYLERFLKKVVKTESCWIWTGAINSGGYGNFKAYGKYYHAHRFIYEELVAVIGQGLQLDHLCRNRKCVNPAHLEPVTCQTNILRGESSAAKQAKQTHCIRGHEFTESNTRRDTNNKRTCRKCHAIRQAKYRNK